MENINLVINVAKEAGFLGDKLTLAVAIAGAESAFNPNKIGDVYLEDSKWGPSIGLWQIRSLTSPESYGYPDNGRIESKLFDPAYNAKMAYAISNGGMDFSPWSTFTGGDYKNFISEVENAINRSD